MIYFILDGQILHVFLGLFWFLCWETLFQRQECGFYLFAVTGFDLWLSVLTLGIVCTVYTALVSVVSLRRGRGDGRRKKGMR